MKLSSVLKITKNDFLRHILTLASGTTLANLTSIALIPLLTRIYTPEDYGAFSIYLAVNTVIAVIACFRYELTIVLPQNDKEALNLLSLSIGSTIVLALTLLAPIILIQAITPESLINQASGKWLWAIPLSVFVTGIYQSINYWLIRGKQFKVIASATIMLTGITLAAQLILGIILGSSLLGLLIGHLLGQTTSTLYFIIHARRSIKVCLNRHTIDAIKTLAHRYRSFPLVSSWSAVLNSVSSQLPTLLLSFFFPVTVVGFIALANRFLGIPMRLIGTSISQVFYQRATVAQRDRSLKKLMVSITKKQAVIIIPGITIIALISPNLFDALLGKNWGEVGHIIQLISPAIAAQFIVSPISTVGSILNLQTATLVWTALRTIGSIVAISLGGSLMSLDVALASYSTINCAAYLLLLYYYLKHAELSDNRTALPHQPYV